MEIALIAFVVVLLFGVRHFQAVRSRKIDAEVKARIAGVSRAIDEAQKLRFLTDKGQGTKPQDWTARRRFVLERDGHRCTRCGSSAHLHVHHINKRSESIDHTTPNLVTLCIHCHAKEDGHGVGLVSALTAARASRLGYVRRRGRKTYTCSSCRAEIPKGTISFPRKPTKDGGS